MAANDRPRRRWSRRLRVGCGSTFAIVFMLGVSLWILNATVASRRDRPFEGPRLSPRMEMCVPDLVSFRTHFGDEVWPGFGHAELPLVLFNDDHRFLVSGSAPPGVWSKLSDLGGIGVWVAEGGEPSYFAVAVGDRWAAGIGVIGRMNRDLLLDARSQLPPVAAQLAPYWLFTMSPDRYASMVVHEWLHAFQSTKSPGMTQSALSGYELLDDYPADDAFRRSWNREGSLLRAALEAGDESERRALAAEFLEVRRARRAGANLAASFVDLERELEWLEGLAFYAEIRSYELGAEAEFRILDEDFEDSRPYWKESFWRLENRLGEQDGDLRFYLSGMAQARLLDQLSPGWKTDGAMEDIVLEDLVEAAVIVPE